MKSVQEFIRQLPDLNDLAERLAKEPEAFLKRAFPDEDRRHTGPVSFGAGDPHSDEPGRAFEVARDRARSEVLEVGRRAVEKVAAEGDRARLAPEETFALEAITLLEGRPALFIQNGAFFPPPEQWRTLEGSRAAIENACRSVGRIEVTGHSSLDWIGTGFLVGEDVVMTNRHVALEFCRLEANQRWGLQPPMTAQIDYVEELGAVNSAEFALTEVIGIHDTLDLALLRVEGTSPRGVPSPPPLPIAADASHIQAGSRVYTVGYPAWDGRRNDPEAMQRIFSNVFNVKRLQPGEVMQVFEPHALFLHDCSTLGGNSGSCVVDLEAHRVIGLHFGGRFREGNQAIALWTLRNDPLFPPRSLNFV